MFVFFSGSSSGAVGSGTDDDPRLIAAAETHYRLCSCHGSYLNVAHTTVKRIIDAGYGKNCELLLDSGAFTAWSKGDEVTLDHLIPVYAKFIEDYEHNLKAIYMINLDKIPAEKGRTARPEELIEAMKIGDSNFEVLKKHFAKRVLPVYHQNEPKEQLLTLAANCDYICISPRNDLPEGSRVKWAQEAHSLVPGLKTHGLATTGAHMMATVPWGSVDSATWLNIGAFGGIILEGPAKLRIMQISEKSGSIKEWGCHFDTLSSVEQDIIASRIVEYGFSVEEMRLDHCARMLFNRIALIRYAERYSCIKTKNSQPVQHGLFDF